MHTVLHDAAAKGDIKAMLSHWHLGINQQDEQLKTPLFFAVIHRQWQAVNYLLNNGAKPYLSDAFDKNIIDYAKDHKKHTPLSRYLKKRIGLSKKRLHKFSNQFGNFIAKELKRAKSQSKKLLLILGECHGNYRLYQIEKVILKIVSKIGINHLFVELHVDSTTISKQYDPMINKKQQNMTIIGVDNHPERNTASMKERNVYMKSGIEFKNVDGVLITGLHHLHGLVKYQKTRVCREQFKVVPFNLLAFYSSKENNTKEEQFAFNAKKVWQLRRI